MKIIDFTQSEDYHVTMSLRLERPEWEPRLKQAALELQRFLTLRAQAQDISVEDLLAQMGGRERAALELQRQKIMKLLSDSAETVDVELERLPGEDPAVPVLMPPY